MKKSKMFFIEITKYSFHKSTLNPNIDIEHMLHKLSPMLNLHPQL